ncbi:MAG: threonylcarbamoyl-AMP synthase [Gammaproteobacteria bacterium]|nr:MAG: threonylcarbamoyl-AMP synthase [Gammaproteobacteria bacterium]
MAQVISIHPDNPQPRLVAQAAEAVRSGGVIVYPTDSGYALGCRLDDKQAVERLRRVRRLDERHHLTLVCRDLSELSRYAKVDNTAYRLMKRLTPGPYTFILPATHEVPRRLWHPKRKTIGLRVPDNRIAQALLDALGEPLISTTLILPGESLPLTDPWEIDSLIGNQVDLVIDGGYGGLEPTTVIDLTGEVPQVVREGAGPVDWEE